MLRPRAVEMSMSSLVSDVARRVRRLVEQASQTLEIHPSAHPTVARIDPDLIGRVLTNLIENAVKHGPRGGRIEVSVASNDGVVRIEVVDGGQTIAEDSREVIFRVHQRITADSPGLPRGYGLGLTFCRLAVEAHGGRVGVLPNEPAGNCLFVERPPLIRSVVS